MYATPSPPSLFSLVVSQIADSLKVNPAAQAPTDYEAWLRLYFAKSVTTFAPHHHDLWRWVDAIRLGEKPPEAFIGIFPRGGGKSESAELATVYLGAKRKRRNGLYVRSDGEQADNSVDNIGSKLESPLFGEAYPEISNKQVGKYGQA